MTEEKLKPLRAYPGDSVYARFNFDNIELIELYTDNGYGATNHIYLDREIVSNLNYFVSIIEHRLKELEEAYWKSTLLPTPRCKHCNYPLSRWGWFEDPSETIAYWICGNPAKCNWDASSIQIHPRAKEFDNF